jgi:hypothetical protein
MGNEAGDVVPGGLIAKEPNQYSSDRYPATEYCCWLHRLLWFILKLKHACVLVLAVLKNLLLPPILSILYYG